MTRRAPLLVCAIQLLLLLSTIQEAWCSGVLTIRLTGFQNPQGRTYDGACCDPSPRDHGSTCFDQCDYVMRLIVTGLGRANDHVFLFHRPLKYDSNNIVFEQGDSNLLLTVLFDQWPVDGQVKMNAFFYDYDDFDHTTTLVDWFETDLQHSKNIISNQEDIWGHFQEQTVTGNRQTDKTVLSFEWSALSHVGAEYTLPPSGEDSIVPEADPTTMIHLSTPQEATNRLRQAWSSGQEDIYGDIDEQEMFYSKRYNGNKPVSALGRLKQNILHRQRSHYGIHGREEEKYHSSQPAADNEYEAVESEPARSMPNQSLLRHGEMLRGRPVESDIAVVDKDSSQESADLMSSRESSRALDNSARLLSSYDADTKLGVYAQDDEDDFKPALFDYRRPRMKPFIRHNKADSDTHKSMSPYRSRHLKILRRKPVLRKRFGADFLTSQSIFSKEDLRKTLRGLPVSRFAYKTNPQTVQAVYDKTSSEQSQLLKDADVSETHDTQFPSLTRHATNDFSSKEQHSEAEIVVTPNTDVSLGEQGYSRPDQNKVEYYFVAPMIKNGPPHIELPAEALLISDEIRTTPAPLLYEQSNSKDTKATVLPVWDDFENAVNDFTEYPDYHYIADSLDSREPTDAVLPITDDLELKRHEIHAPATSLPSTETPLRRKAINPTRIIHAPATSLPSTETPLKGKATNPTHTHETESKDGFSAKKKTRWDRKVSPKVNLYTQSSKVDSSTIDIKQEGFTLSWRSDDKLPHKYKIAENSANHLDAANDSINAPERWWSMFTVEPTKTYTPNMMNHKKPPSTNNEPDITQVKANHKPNTAPRITTQLLPSPTSSDHAMTSTASDKTVGLPSNKLIPKLEPYSHTDLMGRSPANRSRKPLPFNDETFLGRDGPSTTGAPMKDNDASSPRVTSRWWSIFTESPDKRLVPTWKNQQEIINIVSTQSPVHSKRNNNFQTTKSPEPFMLHTTPSPGGSSEKEDVAILSLTGQYKDVSIHSSTDHVEVKNAVTAPVVVPKNAAGTNIVHNNAGTNTVHNAAGINTVHSKAKDKLPQEFTESVLAKSNHILAKENDKADFKNAEMAFEAETINSIAHHDKVVNDEDIETDDVWSKEDDTKYDDVDGPELENDTDYLSPPHLDDAESDEGNTNDNDMDDSKSKEPETAVASQSGEDEDTETQHPRNEHHNQVGDVAEIQHSRNEHPNQMSDVAETQNPRKQHPNQVGDVAEIQHSRNEHPNQMSDVAETQIPRKEYPKQVDDMAEIQHPRKGHPKQVGDMAESHPSLKEYPIQVDDVAETQHPQKERPTQVYDVNELDTKIEAKGEIAPSDLPKPAKRKIKPVYRGPKLQSNGELLRNSIKSLKAVRYATHAPVQWYVTSQYIRKKAAADRGHALREYSKDSTDRYKVPVDRETWFDPADSKNNMQTILDVQPSDSLPVDAVRGLTSKEETAKESATYVDQGISESKSSDHYQMVTLPPTPTDTPSIDAFSAKLALPLDRKDLVKPILTFNDNTQEISSGGKEDSLDISLDAHPQSSKKNAIVFSPPRQNSQEKNHEKDFLQSSFSRGTIKQESGSRTDRSRHKTVRPPRVKLTLRERVPSPPPEAPEAVSDPTQRPENLPGIKSQKRYNGAVEKEQNIEPTVPGHLVYTTRLDDTKDDSRRVDISVKLISSNKPEKKIGRQDTELKQEKKDNSYSILTSKQKHNRQTDAGINDMPKRTFSLPKKVGLMTQHRANSQEKHPQSELTKINAKFDSQRTDPNDDDLKQSKTDIHAKIPQPDMNGNQKLNSKQDVLSEEFVKIKTSSQNTKSTLKANLSNRHDNVAKTSQRPTFYNPPVPTESASSVKKTHNNVDDTLPNVQKSAHTRPIMPTPSSETTEEYEIHKYLAASGEISEEKHHETDRINDMFSPASDVTRSDHTKEYHFIKKPEVRGNKENKSKTVDSKRVHVTHNPSTKPAPKAITRPPAVWNDKNRMKTQRNANTRAPTPLYEVTDMTATSEPGRSFQTKTSQAKSLHGVDIKIHKIDSMEWYTERPSFSTDEINMHKIKTGSDWKTTVPVTTKPPTTTKSWTQLASTTLNGVSTVEMPRTVGHQNQGKAKEFPLVDNSGFQPETSTSPRLTKNSSMEESEPPIGQNVTVRDPFDLMSIFMANQDLLDTIARLKNRQSKTSADIEIDSAGNVSQEFLESPSSKIKHVSTRTDTNDRLLLTDIPLISSINPASSETQTVAASSSFSEKPPANTLFGDRAEKSRMQAALEAKYDNDIAQSDPSPNSTQLISVQKYQSIHSTKSKPPLMNSDNTGSVRKSPPSLTNIDSNLLPELSVKVNAPAAKTARTTSKPLETTRPPSSTTIKTLPTTAANRATTATTTSSTTTETSTTVGTTTTTATTTPITLKTSTTTITTTSSSPTTTDTPATTAITSLSPITTKASTATTTTAKSTTVVSPTTTKATTVSSTIIQTTSTPSTTTSSPPTTQTNANEISTTLLSSTRETTTQVKSTTTTVTTESTTTHGAPLWTQKMNFDVIFGKDGKNLPEYNIKDTVTKTMNSKRGGQHESRLNTKPDLVAPDFDKADTKISFSDRADMDSSLSSSDERSNSETLFTPMPIFYSFTNTLPEKGFVLHTLAPEVRSKGMTKKPSYQLPSPKLSRSETGIRKNTVHREINLDKFRSFIKDIRYGPTVSVPNQGLYKPENFSDSNTISDGQNPVDLPTPVKRYSSPYASIADVGTVFTRYWPAVLGVCVGTIFLLTALVTSVLCRQRRLLVQRARWADSPQHVSEPPDTSEYASSSEASLTGDLTRSSINLM